MPFNLQQYRGAVGAFNNRFNYNNIHNRVLDRNPNVSLIANVYFAILRKFCTFLPAVGFFDGLFRKNIKTISLLAIKIQFIYLLSTYLFHVWLCLILMKRSGDIEQNPGPKPSSCQCFSICHWNLNRISMHNFIKLSLLRPYIAILKFDVVCLSETYLNASISNDDDSLKFPGYNLLRADHLSNTK